MPRYYVFILLDYTAVEHARTAVQSFKFSFRQNGQDVGMSVVLITINIGVVVYFGCLYCFSSTSTTVWCGAPLGLII